MRLLNASTKTLEVFLGSDVPPYAILSHTWEQEEVVHDDLNDENVEHTAKRGWRKIRQACDQALDDGYAYLWADTLCIDKASSSELSEAINSMFNWYRDSAVCYAYLSDLPDVALGASRWFTRGWTLQEMIAPREVKFFDRDWVFQGMKSGLVNQLYHISSVDPMVLKGGSLRLISVAKKMSWSCKRQTTRPEDMAYSLLGLFGISMPMLYGEGSRAFIRLQEEIVKEYDDETIFAWKSDSHVPVPSAGFFARSPADFAHSSHIVPCQSTDQLTEPISVSNRGLRIVAPLHKLDPDQFAEPTFMLRLNCKPVHFDMRQRERIGIIVAKRFGIGHVYSRVHADADLPMYNFKGNVQTIFGLKETHIEDLELADSCGFWVRTPPSWPPPRSYELVLGHPSQYWDARHDMFRREWDDTSTSPFCLVYRSTADTPDGQNSYFVVLLGTTLLVPAPSWSRYQMWCDVKFHGTCDLTAEDLADKASKCTPTSFPKGRDKHAVAEGDGLRLKCYVQLEVVYGQHLFVADLHVKDGGDPV